jgi:hypothetical protein
MLRDNRKKTGERASLGVEAAFEELVGRVDLRLMEERDERDREHDHRDRQRVVELQEAHAVHVALAGRADHRDRAELRGHHRQPHGPPGQTAAAEEIALHLLTALREPQPIPDDPHEIRRDDRPVDGMHGRQEKAIWNM